MEDAPSFTGQNFDPIDASRDTFKALSAFLDATPVIQTEDDARAGKLQLDRAKAGAKDLVDAQQAEAKPHREHWQTALDRYKPALNNLNRLLDELSSRLTVFAKAEKARREAEAEVARKAAQEAERVARKALAQEEEAKANQAVGEFDTGLGNAITNTDQKIADLKRAEHIAAIAERDTHVKLGGGFSRAVGLRTKTTLILDDAAKALAEVGVTEKVREALLSAARDYKRLKGVLPAGVHEETEQVI